MASDPPPAGAGSPDAGERPPTAEEVSKLPWPVLLGLRTGAVESRSRIVDQVVLVPDGRTYLEEVSRWTDARRWPVLIEDDFYAPTFVRGFRPAQVVRRPSAGTMPASREERERLIARAAAEAIDDGATDAIAASRARGVPPSMLVVTDAMDGAWTAALALSAGRVGPIHFTDADFGRPADVLDAAAFARLSAELERGAERSGLPWRGLGDFLDAFVICRDFGWRSVVEFPPGVRWEMGGTPAPAGQPVATLNAIGRHPDGVPWALGGGIFGSEARCAYVAMCALFAPRERAWLFNSYGSDANTAAYEIESAAELLASQGFEVRSWPSEKLGFKEWRRILMGGFGCDVLLVNTRGMANEFNLWGGEICSAFDVPFFDRPCAVHFTHSFSLQVPTDPGTIGGAFIENGAYAYFGSVHEPYLNAFVPPKMLAQRFEAYVPFGAASRQFEGAFARPWRVACYGDPLILVAPPARIKLERIAPDDASAVDVREQAVESLRRYRDDADPRRLAAAIADLEAIGDDELLLRAWKIAESTEAASAAAPHALGALFRSRDLDGYARAMAKAGAPDRRSIVMLWQLATPRVGGISDPATIVVLGLHTRGQDPSADLATIRPTGVRVLGAEAWGALCDRVRARIGDEGLARRIDALR